MSVPLLESLPESVKKGRQRVCLQTREWALPANGRATRLAYGRALRKLPPLPSRNCGCSHQRHVFMVESVAFSNHL